MRILLTGVTGQIGAALVKSLSGHEIVVTDRKTLDLAKVSAIAGPLGQLHPELILNCAAYTQVDAAESEPEVAFAINAKAVAAIGMWASENSVPVIHFSTDYVYDGSGSRPWLESDLTGPISVYARSKLAGEDNLRRSGASHLIVRTSWIYSASGRSFLGTIARAALVQPELRVVADQVGAPTSAATLADAVAAILQNPRENLTALFQRTRGLVHITAAGYASWHGFASSIVDGLRCRNIDVKCRTIHAISTAEYPTPATRPQNSRMSLTRLNDVLAISTPHWRLALEAELDRFVALLECERTRAGPDVKRHESARH